MEAEGLVSHGSRARRRGAYLVSAETAQIACAFTGSSSSAVELELQLAKRHTSAHVETSPHFRALVIGLPGPRRNRTGSSADAPTRGSPSSRCVPCGARPTAPSRRCRGTQHTLQSPSYHSAPWGSASWPSPASQAPPLCNAMSAAPTIRTSRPTPQISSTASPSKRAPATRTRAV